MKEEVEKVEKVEVDDDLNESSNEGKAEDWNLDVEEHSFSACMMNTGS